jgi:preprotein translocase subunit SecE
VVGARERRKNRYQMAKSAIAERLDDNSLVTKVKAWPQRVKSFYNDVRTEMRKVTTPSRKEVQGTTTVVIITVFLFALYFFIVDRILSMSLDHWLKTMTHR